jgi:ribosomal protein S18 acetylase RimI-like enzyme
VDIADPALVEMFDRQSAAFFIAARERPWADIRIDDDVIWGTTGLPLANFNGATQTAFTEATADDRIETVLRRFRDERIPMVWWVGPTATPADLADRLVAHGLVREEAAPGMAVSLDGWSPPVPRDGITTELVADAAAFHVSMQIMFAGFEMPAEILPDFESRFADFCIGPRAIQRVFLALLEGRPVATSLGFALDGVVGIYNVATLPDARRAGAGMAATVAAMADARARGARSAILESSPMARPMYERIGFRQVCEVTVLSGAFDD